MSELDQLRQGQNFDHRPLETANGAGVLWALAAIVVVFALIFGFAAFTGGEGENPAAGGSAPVVAPEEIAPVTLD